jgi:hypothetical protein
VARGQGSDKVTVSGALPSYRGRIAIRLFGPFRTVDTISCAGEPYWSASFAVEGPGSYATPAVALALPGIYQYQEIAPADANHVGFTTPCNAPSERVRVRAGPALHTVVSAQTASPGTAITDTITVSGLAGEHVDVTASLFGPFPARDAVRCTGTPPGRGWSTSPPTATTRPLPSR